MRIRFTFLTLFLSTFFVAQKAYAELAPVDFGGFFQFIGLAIFVLVLVFAVYLVSNVVLLIAHTPRAHQKEAEISAIIQHLTDGLILHDDNNTLVLINPAAQKLLGVDAKKAVGSRVLQKPHTSFDPYGNLSRIFFLRLQEGREYERERKEIMSGEIRVEKPEVRELVVLSIPMYTLGKKQERRHMKIIRDVTRERFVSRMKSEFISIAAHQLRTPLSGINWALNVLLSGSSGPLKDQQKDIVTQARDSAERIIQLASDLLDASRIEEGRFGYSFQENDIHDFTAKLLEEFLPKFNEKKTSFEYKTPKAHFRFFFDPEKLRIAFHNILDNALHYTLSGGKVSIRIASKGDFAHIQIQDTGVGISQEDQGRIFSKFFRSKKAISLNTEGSGLGLFIARNIIVAHGGSISLASEEGKGTTVTVTLPLRREQIPQHEPSFEEVVGVL